MGYINIQIPVTPAIESLLAALLQQDGVSISRGAEIEKPEESRDFVTLAQGADIVGVNYSTFREWVVERKQIPYTRPSGSPQGKVMVRRDHIEQLLAGKRVRKKPGRPGRGVSVI